MTTISLTKPFNYSAIDKPVKLYGNPNGQISSSVENKPSQTNGSSQKQNVSKTSEPATDAKHQLAAQTQQQYNAKHNVNPHYVQASQIGSAVNTTA